MPFAFDLPQPQPTDRALARLEELSLPLVLASSQDLPGAPAAPTFAARLDPVTESEPVPVAQPIEVGMVARFRRRLFNPLGSLRGGKAAEPPALKGLADFDAVSPAKTPKTAKQAKDKDKAASGRDVGFKASLAEFLLINRLRARIRPQPTQPVQSPEVLERAEKIIYVTCEDWFGDSEFRSSQSGTRL